MKQTDKLFQITLPKAIALLRVQFEFVMENDDKFAPFVAEVCDAGGGAYLKLNMPEDVAFDPEELRDLTNTLLDVCRFMDERKERRS